MTFTSHSSPSDLEPVRLFNLFMSKDRKLKVDVGMVLGGTFIIRVSQKELYFSSSKIRIGVKEKKKSAKRGLR